jgi:hypothetical protein
LSDKKERKRIKMKSTWPYTYSLITLGLIVHLYITMSHHGNLFLDQAGHSTIGEQSGESVMEPNASFRARRNTQTAVSLVYTNFGFDSLILALMVGSAFFRRREMRKEGDTGGAKVFL